MRTQGLLGLRAQLRDFAAMSRYTLGFLDATSIQEDDDRDQLDTEAGLEALVASRFFLTPSRIAIHDWDGGWVDFSVWFDVGDDLAALRTETERILRLCGRDVDVFSVTDEAGTVVLTEEEFWDLSEPKERYTTPNPRKRKP